MMKPERAIELLRDINSPGNLPLEENGLRNTFTSWLGKNRAILVECFDEQDNLIYDIDNTSFSPGGFSTTTPDSVFERAYRSGVRAVTELSEVAIFRLEITSQSDPIVDELSIDPSLWNKVHKFVADEDWETVASQTAIFVEHQVREWSGNEGGRNGNALVGKNLMAEVFKQDGDFRLGAQSSEYEGWRSLAIGFILALGNVNRHRIQKRADTKRYAMGVLGTGSLLLTQMRHDLADQIAEYEGNNP